MASICSSSARQSISIADRSGDCPRHSVASSTYFKSSQVDAEIDDDFHDTSVPVSSLLQQKSPKNMLSSFSRPLSASKEKVFNNTMGYVDDQIGAVTTVLTQKKQLEKKKQDLRFRLSQFKEETQSLTKQIGISQTKYDKQMNTFSET